MFFRPRFGRNYFLFLSHPYFGQNCPFFRCIFLFSAYSHRNFGQFYVLPLIPVEIPFRFFFPSAFFATKFRPDRKYHFFTSYSRQNSVFFRRFIVSPSYSSRNSMKFVFFFWRFICFPAFPWNFLIVAIYFFAALFSFIRVKTPYFGDLFVILYFSTLSFFLQFLGKTPK